MILWLNGGPGCSSAEGWITENGVNIFKDGKFINKMYVAEESKPTDRTSFDICNFDAWQ